MNIEIIAAAIESVFYAGRPKSDKKLSREDFLQLAKMAHGTLMRKLYFDAVNNDADVYLYFGEQVETKVFPVGDPDSRRRRVLQLDSEAMRLPNGLGIFSIAAATDGSCECSGKFHEAAVGSDWLYTGREYAGVLFYIKKGQKIYLYNAPACLKEVEVDGIFDDESIDIPEDVAFDVVNAVLGTTLQVAGFPVDKTSDNNPNVTTVKQRLAQTESL